MLLQALALWAPAVFASTRRRLQLGYCFPNCGSNALNAGEVDHCNGMNEDNCKRDDDKLGCLWIPEKRYDDILVSEAKCVTKAMFGKKLPGEFTRRCDMRVNQASVTDCTEDSDCMCGKKCYKGLEHIDPTLDLCLDCPALFEAPEECKKNPMCVFIAEGDNKGCHTEGEMGKRDTFVDKREGETQRFCLARNKQGLGRSCNGEPDDPACTCGSKCVSKEGRGRPETWDTVLHLTHHCRICIDNLEEKHCRDEDGCMWMTALEKCMEKKMMKPVVCKDIKEKMACNMKWDDGCMWVAKKERNVLEGTPIILQEEMCAEKAVFGKRLPGEFMRRCNDRVGQNLPVNCRYQSDCLCGATCFKGLFNPDFTQCVSCPMLSEKKEVCMELDNCEWVDEGDQKGCWNVGERNMRDTFSDLRKDETQLKCLARNKQVLGRQCSGPGDEGQKDCTCGSKCVALGDRGRPTTWKTATWIQNHCRICRDNLEETHCRAEDGCMWMKDDSFCMEKNDMKGGETKACAVLEKDDCVAMLGCKYKDNECMDMVCPTNASEKKCNKITGCIYSEMKCIVDDGKTPKKPSKKVCKKAKKDRAKCEGAGCKYSEKKKGGKTKKKCVPMK